MQTQSSDIHNLRRLRATVNKFCVTHFVNEGLREKWWRVKSQLAVVLQGWAGLKFYLTTGAVTRLHKQLVKSNKIFQNKCWLAVWICSCCASGRNTWVTVLTSCVSIASTASLIQLSSTETTFEFLVSQSARLLFKLDYQTSPCLWIKGSPWSGWAWKDLLE